MLTQLEACTYLAEQLPDKIRIETGYCSYNREYQYFAHKDKNCYGQDIYILETEWQQIALWVEEKILAHHWNIYLVKLWHLTCDKEGQQPSCAYGSSLCMLALVRANYTTRATAMKESGL